ncbi:MAG TPA: bifunctional serine/threonine-protein kinase/formylglycine-generating enzyme family protein [Planctomycetota bacterium]|nr:bifunctional serine/threonine-protein kinase/formylglycine-generating enzyme family protein [Planctomycetota bacterium]
MRCGAYEIEGELGRGGMGVVLRARGPDGRRVALKILNRSASAQTVARFERERRLLGALGEEQGFVALLDAGKTDDGPYIVMPLVEGGTLRDRLKEGPLGIDETLALGRELARALGAAHRVGIVHRDVKPENVLFTKEGRPLLSDLGLGKHYRHDLPGASQSVQLSKDGQMLGTPRYMAPEQASSGETGPPADVFALGGVLYECLAGRPAFAGDTLSEVLARMAGGNFDPLLPLRPEAPRWLVRVIERALSPEPARRFADGDAFLRALREPRPRIWPWIATVGLLAALSLLAAARGKTDEHHVAPVTSAVVTRQGPPGWYLELRESARPALPLPEGLVFGEHPGEYLNPKDGSVLVFVPGGSFIMGTDDGESTERPAHEVHLSPYFIGKYEVTVEQFGRFVQATGLVTAAEKEGVSNVFRMHGVGRIGKEGASWRDPEGIGRAPPPTWPVTQINWDEATAYCKWAGLSVPTEAQWERAAGWDASRGRARRYAWGDEELHAGSPLYANVANETARKRWPQITCFDGYDTGLAGPAPVGSFPLGASPVGALDMTGNASEWVKDSPDPGFYESSRGALDPCCEGGERSLQRVVRGEEWLGKPSYSRVARRSLAMVFERFEGTGLRVARSIRKGR